MRPTATTRVKICCIASLEEARDAVEAGASALGLVSEMPSGPGVIPEARIAEIASRVPPGVASFLLTCRQDAPSIIEQHRRCRTSAVQLCDALENEAYAELRQGMPGIALIQVIHVRGKDSVADAVRLAPCVDALLLDSGNPALAIKELGGTGRTHDWELSRAIREQAGVPVFLAGGLKPENVAEAIRTVRPYGVDVCSGVRSGGRLDAGKLNAFMRAARKEAG